MKRPIIARGRRALLTAMLLTACGGNDKPALPGGDAPADGRATVSIEFTAELVDADGNGFTAPPFSGTCAESVRGIRGGASAGTRSVSTGSGAFEYGDGGQVAIQTVLYTVRDGYYGKTYNFFFSDDPDLRVKPESGNYVTIVIREPELGTEFDLAAANYTAGYDVRYNGTTFVDPYTYTDAEGTLKVVRNDDGTFLFAVDATKNGVRLTVDWSGTPADIDALPKEELPANTYEADNRQGRLEKCFTTYDESTDTDIYYVMESPTATEADADDALFTVKLSRSDVGRELDIAAEIALADGEFVMMNPRTEIRDGRLKVVPAEEAVAIELSNAAGTIRMRYEGPCESFVPSQSGDPVLPGGWTYAFGAIAEATFLPGYREGTTLLTFYAADDNSHFELEVDDSYLTGREVVLQVGGGGPFFELRHAFYDEDIEDTTEFKVSNASGGQTSLGTPSGDIRFKFVKPAQ